MVPPASRRSLRLRRTAEEVFGHSSLLPGQEQAMRALLDGHDVLLVAPTGGGKSLNYQVTGLLLEGCTVVVSPLLALQRDQIESLTEQAPDFRAARLSSHESPSQREEVLAQAAAGEVEFLFCSPEQLANDEVRTRVAALEPSLVAVDEAHCVSAWGHDFRPDYFRLGDLVEQLGSPRVIAMTATAAPPVRADIVERLRLEDCRTVVTGFERDNLDLAVRRATDPDDQQRAVLELVEEAAGQGIVYCRTRKAAEEYAALLADQGREPVVYHAGLGRRQRAEAYDAFVSDRADTVVATSAFGMGIDKPDIRFVVHAQVPESPDTYYQEVGRAGRDGEQATGTLVYRPEDLSLGRFFSGGVPKEEDVRAVVAALDVAAVEASGADQRAVAERSGLGPRKVGRILNLLQQVAETDGEPADVAGAVAAVVARAEAHRQLQRSRVEMVRGYAETERCRAAYLLTYFGEEQPALCGRCDNCRAGVAADHADAAERADTRFSPQSRVRHREFGEGTVTDVEEDRLTVLFEDVGYRTLSLALVEEEGLLQASG